ncbi:MAG: CAP domain-containing protein [Gaiellaceae bacterium]
MTWARGRITYTRHAAYPVVGRDDFPHPSYGGYVPATAAAPVRIGLTALLFAALAAFVVVGSADGGGRAWNAYLAPASACKGSTDLSASPAVQRRAVTCLVNWARAQDRRGRLAQSSSLERAAGLKGHKVVSCGQISHTPCGSDLTASLRAAGYRYSSFGENLYVGPLGSASARDVVLAWLQSPGHRANVLGAGFRDVGTALVRADGLFGDGQAVVWIAAFASPR